MHRDDIALLKLQVPAQLQKERESVMSTNSRDIAHPNQNGCRCWMGSRKHPCKIINNPCVLNFAYNLCTTEPRLKDHLPVELFHLAGDEGVSVQELQEVDRLIVSNSHCFFLHAGDIERTHICAGGTNGKDACSRVSSTLH
ncbi:hypothetical protein NPIL_287911 [Nephila pilipes]|uniref:Uncharacterized protein n=1 Tax=Nephila pilipes TaxID=299642 RepID=A0A8X6QF86_NEPPI|nr:hypothetical protein NPIL_287911 [Nephila pilipes]